MSKHTEGPWEVARYPVSGGPQYEIHARKKDRGLCIVAELGVATVATAAGPDIEREANARLIAAAPDLLEACKDVLRAYVGLHETYWNQHRNPVEEAGLVKAARAAIAKAEGK